jgi:hypothetical protein
MTFKKSPATVHLLAQIALCASIFFIIKYNYIWYVIGYPENPSALIGAIVFAYIAILAFVIAECLQDFESRLPPK